MWGYARPPSCPGEADEGGLREEESTIKPDGAATPHTDTATGVFYLSYQPIPAPILPGGSAAAGREWGAGVGHRPRDVPDPRPPLPARRRGASALSSQQGGQAGAYLWATAGEPRVSLGKLPPPSPRCRQRGGPAALPTGAGAGGRSREGEAGRRGGGGGRGGESGGAMPGDANG